MDGISCHRQLGTLFAASQAEKYPGFELLIKALDYAEPVIAAPRLQLIQYINNRLNPVWLGIEPVANVCREIAAEVRRMQRAIPRQPYPSQVLKDNIKNGVTINAVV